MNSKHRPLLITIGTLPNIYLKKTPSTNQPTNPPNPSSTCSQSDPWGSGTQLSIQPHLLSDSPSGDHLPLKYPPAFLTSYTSFYAPEIDIYCCFPSNVPEDVLSSYDTYWGPVYSMAKQLWQIPAYEVLRNPVKHKPTGPASKPHSPAHETHPLAQEKNNQKICNQVVWQ